MSDVTEGLPRDVVCPACFKPVPSEQTVCGACGAGVWVDEKLVLVGALEEGRSAAFRGLLRDDDGKLEDVAVKVLDVGGLPNWREYERFRRQTEILGSLKHPRIPRARGDFEVKGRVLHCQTRVAGRNLARQLRGARVTSDEATRLAEELLELLAYLHDRDVVHRDVKPDNVIIDAEGAAHLVDFGGARRLHGAAKDGGKLEAEPTVVGTPGYMAPEQARGELMPQSDLYALGKLLLEALGGAKPQGKLGILLPQLVREDWRKRPASAAAALAMLRPPLAIRRNAWPYVALASVAVTGIVLGVRHNVRSPAAEAAVATPVEPAASQGPSLEELARALLADWLVAQNARDMDRYARLYASSFHGTRRTPMGRTVSLDRTAWLAERTRMYSKPVEVRADDVAIEADDAGGYATVTFTQRFRRGTYAEHGYKRLIGTRAGTAMQWLSEEMVYSRPGWNEEEYATQVPLVAADCRVSFDPGAGKHLVVLSIHDEYGEALRAAAKSRKKKVPVEIVWGPDFQDMAEGFWVLAGAMDDADKATALANRIGGEVREARLAEQPSYGITRLIARKPLSSVGCHDHKHFTVVNGTAYVVGQSNNVFTFSLAGSDLVEKSHLPLPAGVKPVRLAARQGAAMVLDDEGHWYQVGNESVERAPTFDPDAAEGKVASFPSVHFAFEGGANLFARLPGADPLPWPVDADTVAVFKASDDRLVVVRDMELFVFALGEPPRRLTKVCATVTPEVGEKLNAPATITLGEMTLSTDRSGKLDVWTGAWGFVQPKISDAIGTPVVSCGDDDELLEIPMMPLFRQTSVSVEATAGCSEVGC